ncbi:MAG TPA: arginine--tRNA ligase, partial [Prevotella sp.]
DRLGFKWGKELVHFSYGMVELPNGKMKSREGTVVDADDLVAEMVKDARQTSDELGKFKDMSEEEKAEIAHIVGLGALKYFILKVDARKNMLFNPEESIDFNGNTGPFIQYTYARIRSIMRKAAAEGFAIPAVLDAQNAPLNDKETQLIQKMNEFETAVTEAGSNYNPAGIANYCYELTKDFNQFYHDYSILNADNAEEKTVRLVIAQNVAKIIKNGMELLGIEVPERM